MVVRRRLKSCHACFAVSTFQRLAKLRIRNRNPFEYDPIVVNQSTTQAQRKTRTRAHRNCYYRSLSIRPLQHYPTMSTIIYDLGFSFFPLYRASRDTPDTFTTLKRQPGISPLDLPLLPKPEISTSSFSSTKLRQPSLGTKQAIFLPFLISCTRTPLRMAELGCLASRPL